MGAVITARGPECESQCVQISIAMASREHLLSPPGTSPVVACPLDHIRRVEVVVSSKVDVQTRHINYPGLDSVLDPEGNSVGHEIHRVLRYLMRYCLSDAPARVCDQQTLESEMMNLLFHFGFCIQDKKFFRWIFSCKIGVRTMIGTLYRGYTTAMDAGIIALNRSLQSPRLDDFGYFLVGEPRIFRLCKKIYFEAIGFSEDQYQDPDVFSKLKMVVNGQAMYGLFTGLLLYMM